MDSGAIVGFFCVKKHVIQSHTHLFPDFVICDAPEINEAKDFLAFVLVHGSIGSTQGFPLGLGQSTRGICEEDN